MDINDRRVWLRAFYGFDPEGAGYIGFTHESMREAMMSRMNDGDLVLIYGAVENLTQQDLRAQALGFLEIHRERCSDHERISRASLDWKEERGFQERWTYGIKVRRAWRVKNRVGIATIAPEAYEGKNRFARTTRAILLTDQERGRALSHPVYEVNVFGEPAIATSDLSNGPMERILKPSAGPAPSFGPRTSIYDDGENYLYLMLLSADADVLLEPSPSTRGKALCKVGRSNSPKDRLVQINAGFPPIAVVKWHLDQQQKFETGAIAHDLETKLKAKFAERFQSQMGEFFAGDRKAMVAAFQEFCVANMPKILGAARKASGI